MNDIAASCRAAGRDERLATGALYLAAADEIERLTRQLAYAMAKREQAQDTIDRLLDRLERRLTDEAGAVKP